VAGAGDFGWEAEKWKGRADGLRGRAPSELARFFGTYPGLRSKLADPGLSFGLFNAPESHRFD
jgi:hypothetical protein